VEPKKPTLRSKPGSEKASGPWRPTKRQVVWAIGMVLALLTTTLLLANFYPEIWKGLLEERNLKLIAIGVSLTAIIVLLAIGGAASSWTGFRGKTVWDLLQLLIVPLALAVIGLWFAAQQEEHQRRVEAKRAKAEQQLENQRADADRDIEDQRAQDITLRTYLDQMQTLLLDRNLRDADRDSNVRNVARARTLTTLAALDAYHKQKVLRFLNETKLIQRSSPDGEPVISLRYAELQEVRLGHTGELGGFDLNGIVAANADLSNAHMLNAVVHGADLREAILSEADLTNADLRGSTLIGADLTNTDLTNTDLTNTDLTDAQVTEEQLEAAKSLAGATMPNGQKYEDWLKSKGHRGDGETGGPS
jgi:uncharacterized protein YjbI with pentapeptide repeats